MSSMPFNFIPRKLTKPIKVSGNSVAPSTTKIQLENVSEKPFQFGQERFAHNLAETSSAHGDASDSHARLGKRRKRRTVLEETTGRILLELSLSDHAIWSDSELLRRMDESPEGCKSSVSFQ